MWTGSEEKFSVNNVHDEEFRVPITKSEAVLVDWVVRYEGKGA